MKVQLWKLSDIKPYPGNPRHNDARAWMWNPRTIPARSRASPPRKGPESGEPFSAWTAANGGFPGFSGGQRPRSQRARRVDIAAGEPLGIQAIQRLKHDCSTWGERFMKSDVIFGAFLILSATAIGAAAPELKEAPASSEPGREAAEPASEKNAEQSHGE